MFRFVVFIMIFCVAFLQPALSMDMDNDFESKKSLSSHIVSLSKRAINKTVTFCQENPALFVGIVSTMLPRVVAGLSAEDERIVSCEEYFLKMGYTILADVTIPGRNFVAAIHEGFHHLCGYAQEWVERSSRVEDSAICYYEGHNVFCLSKIIQ